MGECNKVLQANGSIYPRTCQVCGLGPCTRDQAQESTECQTPQDYRESARFLLGLTKSDAVKTLCQCRRIVQVACDQLDAADEMERAAEDILSMGPPAVIVTGGHLEGDRVVNVLRTEKGAEFWRGEKVSGDFHGTGCVFSAALAGHLAYGLDVPEALNRASLRVAAAIQTAVRIGKGEISLLDP